MRRFRRRKFLLRKKLIKRRSIFLKSFRRFGNFKKIRIKLSPFAYKQPRAYRILKYSKIKVRTRVFRYRSKLRRVHFINNYLISSKIPKKRLNLYFNYLPKRNKYAVVDLRFRGFLNNYITQFRINKLSYNSLLNYIGPASGGWRFRSDLLFRLLRRRKSMKKVRKYSKKLRVQGRLYCTSFISKIMRIGGCHNLQHYKFVMFKKTAIDHFIMKQNPLLFFFSTRYEDSQFNIDNDYVSYLDWIRY